MNVFTIISAVQLSIYLALLAGFCPLFPEGAKRGLWISSIASFCIVELASIVLTIKGVLL